MKNAFSKPFAAGLTAATLLSVPAFAAGMVNGDVQKVDQAAGKISLKHGPIPELDMGEMSMVYRVKDPALLKGIKAGDKIRFEPAEVNGVYTVSRIEKAK